MKNYYILIICFLSSTLIRAQRPDKRAELKALKIGYLTKQLELTSNEAEVLIPGQFTMSLTKRCLNYGNKKF